MSTFGKLGQKTLNANAAEKDALHIIKIDETDTDANPTFK